MGWWVVMSRAKGEHHEHCGAPETDARDHHCTVILDQQNPPGSRHNAGVMEMVLKMKLDKTRDRKSGCNSLKVTRAPKWCSESKANRGKGKDDRKESKERKDPMKGCCGHLSSAADHLHDKWPCH